MEKPERATRGDFNIKYRLVRDPTRQRMEHAVLGSDYGANSYTTIDQANDLAGRLGLRTEVTLLDLGAGSGWPGLYLAASTGCRVILADQPEEGLRNARARAHNDSMADRCSFIQCSGGSLPLREAVVDAVAHTDVLC